MGSSSSLTLPLRYVRIGNESTRSYGRVDEVTEIDFIDQMLYKGEGKEMLGRRYDGELAFSWDLSGE